MRARPLLALLVAATVAVVATSTAHAYEEGFYVGVAGNWMSFEETAADVDLDLGLATFVGGYRFNRYLGMEGTLRTSIRDDSVGPFDVGLDHYFSVALAGRWPITPGFGLYGTAGYGRATFSIRAFNMRFTEAENDVHLGAGIQFQLGTVLMRAGYERLIDSGDIRMQGFKLGVIFDL